MIQAGLDGDDTSVKLIIIMIMALLLKPALFGAATSFGVIIIPYDFVLFFLAPTGRP